MFDYITLPTYRYYDQLVAIEGKFPISENQVCILLQHGVREYL